MNQSALSFGSYLHNSSVIRQITFVLACYFLIQSHFRSVQLLTGFVLFLILFPETSFSKKPAALDSMSLTQLDVGQGTSIHLSIAGSQWLYDTGAQWSEDFDMGQSVIEPYLRVSGIKKLDAIVLSHGDNDHVGGTESILKKIPVNRLILSGTSSQWTFRFGHSVFFNTFSQSLMERCTHESKWILGEYQIKSVWPLSSATTLSDNDSSCVLLIESISGKTLAILPGDISSRVERQLAEQFKNELNAEILFVAHHGSRSSSHSDWLEQINPRWALISSSANNRYGHPHPKVTHRLEERGATVLESSRLGAIRFEYQNGRWIGPYCYRFKGRHFWQQWDNSDVCIGSL
jgi:competence protein ComEC